MRDVNDMTGVEGEYEAAIFEPLSVPIHRLFNRANVPLASLENHSGPPDPNEGRNRDHISK